MECHSLTCAGQIGVMDGGKDHFACFLGQASGNHIALDLVLSVKRLDLEHELVVIHIPASQLLECLGGEAGVLGNVFVGEGYAAFAGQNRFESIALVVYLGELQLAGCGIVGDDDLHAEYGIGIGHAAQTALDLTDQVINILTKHVRGEGFRIVGMQELNLAICVVGCGLYGSFFLSRGIIMEKLEAEFVCL